MRIAYLSTDPFDTPGPGGSVHAYQLTRGLRALGHEVRALALGRSPGPGRLAERARALAAESARSDVVIVRVDGGTGFLALLFAVRLGVPIVLELNAPEDELAASPHRPLVPPAASAVVRRAAALRAAAATCVSAPLVAYARGLGLRRIALVENGSDPRLFRPELRDPRCLPARDGVGLRVLWAGSSAYPWHDFEVMFEAARLLEREAPDVSFYLLGDCPVGQCPGNIQLLPPRPYLEVPPIFASADVGLCLYRDVPWSRFGHYFSPLKLFDHAASGIPTLFSDYPGLRDTARALGLPVRPRDPRALADALLRLRGDPALRESLGRRARALVVEHYNWDRAARQVARLLAEVAPRSIRPT